MGLTIRCAKSAGFCFGVKRAITIALDNAVKARQSQTCIEMLGDIVHNEDVVRSLQEAGIQKISRLRKGKGKVPVIRAHGASKKIMQQATKLGYSIVDATCPMVKEIHSIACALEKKGHRIQIIGDHAHDEVKGIIGQLNHKAFAITRIAEVETLPKKLSKPAVVVQSTQNLETISPLLEKLKIRYPTLKFFNTICNPTRSKQKEIQTLPRENDVMLVIGSKTSANTKRLYELSLAINPRTYWIQSPQEISLDWFKGMRSVGITAGASTPDETTKAVVEFLIK